MNKKIKTKLFLCTAVLLSITGLVTALYVLSVEEAESFFAFKISFVYTLLILAALFLFIASVSKKLFLLISNILHKHGGMEKLLLDLRDGTKTFYKEKRKYHRIKTKGQVLTRIIQKEKDKLIEVLDLSYGGALLGARQTSFQNGETVDLSMHLPLFPQPIDVKGRVVRIERASGRDPKTSDAKNVGIEYLDMPRSDREKLIETINTLS
ncbi:MAG: PilZ domain-containing protein [Candidatus Omnitrophica bacterium]|nr:PilZ domain-containing protein [Candidatus Omnitrophota bacterium]